MSVTTYPAANFQDGLTLNMPGGTGLGLSTWTLNQSTANLPTTFPFKLLVYTTTGTFITTREIVQVSAKNDGLNQVTISLRADEGTTAIDHPNGSQVALVNTAGMENAQNDAIADLYDIVSDTIPVESGGSFSASRVLIETATGFVLFDDTLTVESPQFVFSAEAASGAAETVEVYKPGAVIGGFSGMTPGTPYYSNSSGTLTTTAYLVRIVMARAISATEMIFNPEVSSFQITSGTFTGASANRSDMVYLTSAGGWDRLTSSTPNVGQELIVGQLLKTVASPGTAVAVALSNQVISGFFSVRGQTLVAGTIYYAGASGAISSTKSGSAPIVGIGKTADELFLFPGDRRDSIVVETVLSGENWSAGQVLYQSRSDGLYYRSDADVAESGICERPAVAITTHTGGASNSQQVYLPGSTILGVFGGFSAGWRLYTSSTTGSFAANTPVSYDTFYRVLGHCPTAGVVRLDPQEMIFLPTGVQEKGYCGAGDYTANPAFTKTSMGVNFKKIMVNTPSSITLTSTASLYAAAPTANNITRFGFRFNVTESANPNNAETWWAGTYQTVGN